ncbi:MAG TPA: HD domain-containing phosphohydrolase [Armatimonadota bacterium]|nr:HD domain-containing phosphohydrolase [Armatimonadota bacterium]
MRRALKVYVWFVSVAGIVAVAVTARWGNLEGLPHASHMVLGDVAFFVVMGCLLDMMIVPMARGGAVSAGFAVFYACMLYLGPYLAAFVAVLATLWTDIAVRRGIPFYKTLFNVGHSAISVLAAGGAYYVLMGGRVADVRLADLADVAAIIGSAAVLFGSEVTAVNLAVALERRAPLRSVWIGNARLVLPLDAALAGVGLLVALLYENRDTLFQGYGWAFVASVLVLPTTLLYYGSRLYMDMQRVYDKTLRTLVALKESKIHAGAQETVGHGERVANLASAAADELGMSADDVQSIRYAGYLHDIGDVAVPTQAFDGDHEDAALTEEQATKLRRHAEIGHDILRPIGFLRRVAVLVRHHDRRFDAGPYGPDGEVIPFGSRLLAVAERYDDVTRSAREPLSPDDAVRRLVEESGSRFDRRAVEAFVRMLAREAVVDAVRCEEAPDAI